MKTLLSACALALAFLLPATASAQSVIMVASLTGGEENPAVLTGAVGTAEVAIDTAAPEIAVTLRLFNIPTGTTAGHIHAGPRGVNGPVIIDFPIPTGRTGDLSLTFRVGPGQLRARPEVGVNTFEDAIQSIVGGGAYVNIHSTAFPGGEIRGQLRTPDQSAQGRADRGNTP
jgi:CHRD domain